MPSSLTSLAFTIVMNITMQNIDDTLDDTLSLIIRQMESSLTVLTKGGVLGLVVKTVINVQSTHRIATGLVIFWVTIRTQVFGVSLTVSEVIILYYVIIRTSELTLYF